MIRETGMLKQYEFIVRISAFFVFMAAIAGKVLIPVNTAWSQPHHIKTVAKLPKTLKIMKPMDIYSPDNLYEKINGQAEFYLTAGFVRLKSQWFADANDARSMFEVYVYDMGHGLNAFSVYSAQRPDDAQKVDLTQFAYQTENSLYLVHGPYYVEMIAAAPSENTLSRMTALARNFIHDTPIDTSSVQGPEFFPKKNLEPASIRLIAGNAFGFDRLDRVFTANYNIDGSKVTAFISKRETPRAAKDLARALHAYFMAYGGKDILPGAALKDAKMVEIMDAFTIIVSHDTILTGVHGASTKAQAEALAEAIAHTLREKKSNLSRPSSPQAEP